MKFHQFIMEKVLVMWQAILTLGCIFPVVDNWNVKIKSLLTAYWIILDDYMSARRMNHWNFEVCRSCYGLVAAREYRIFRWIFRDSRWIQVSLSHSVSSDTSENLTYLKEVGVVVIHGLGLSIPVRVWWINSMFIPNSLFKNSNFFPHGHYTKSSRLTTETKYQEIGSSWKQR